MGGGGDDDEEACGGVSSFEATSPQAPLAHLSDICAWSTTETATSVEVTCDVCTQVGYRRV